MMLVLLIAIPVVGGLGAWAAARWGPDGSRWVSLAAIAANLLLSLALWAELLQESSSGQWLAEFSIPWVPQFGIGFHLALDGLSLLLVVLTQLLGCVAIVADWHEAPERPAFFHLNLLLTLAGVTGALLAIDLFLFYFFWELMLVPAFLLFLWGGPRRLQAGVKFILFTQAGGLLMLLALLGLYLIHGQAAGTYTFEYTALLGTNVNPTLALWLMLGLFAGFAVKLPAFPVHSWLPDAYTESPTAGAIVLAGIMTKTAGYGLLRFVVPLFPAAALSFAPVAMGLAVIGILYGAWLAFGQTDIRRLVACSSISHMGFVLLGVFAWNEVALTGVVVQMLAHGLVIAALFALVAFLERRTGTREIARLGGLWSTAPGLGAVALFFALALLGLPGLASFLGEFLILAGAFSKSPLLAALAASGLVFSVIYALWLVQRTFQGPNRAGWRLADLAGHEAALAAALVVFTLWLGLFPQPVIDTARQALRNLQGYAAGAAIAPQPTAGTLARFIATGFGDQSGRPRSEASPGPSQIGGHATGCWQPNLRSSRAPALARRRQGELL